MSNRRRRTDGKNRLHALRRFWRRSKPKSEQRTPTVETLEDRTLLAINTIWNSSLGRLEFQTDAADAIIIGSLESSGTQLVALKIDSTYSELLPPSGGSPITVATADVQELVITATGNFNNTINLSGMTRSTFPALTASSSSFQVTINAGEGNDSVVGSPFADSILAESGNDTVKPGLGNDWVNLGSGNDTYIDAPTPTDPNPHSSSEETDGDDTVYAGIGNDTVQNGAGNETFYLEDGADLLERITDGGEGISGDGGEGRGDDSIEGGLGNDTIDGGEGADIIYGDAGNDEIDGGEGGGYDTVYGGDGSDDLSDSGGGEGSSLGEDFLLGGAGNDTLHSIEGTDILLGEGGNDQLTADGGEGSILVGGDGGDTIYGGGGEDILLDGDLPYAPSLLIANLDKIRDEWQVWTKAASTTLSPLLIATYERTVRRLLGELSTGANDPIYLDVSELVDDEDADTLAGSGGIDWFLRDLSNNVIVARDPETQSPLDPGEWIGDGREFPIPINDSIYVPASLSQVTLLVGDLVANDDNRGQGNISITSVSHTSTSGSSVTLNAGQSPPNIKVEFGSLDEITFSYFIAIDVNGETYDSPLPATVVVRKVEATTTTRSGDFNGDGLTDALVIDPVAGSPTGGSLSVMLNRSGVLSAWGSVPTDIAWRHWTVGQFTRSGHDDVIALNGLTNEWYIWRAKNGGGFNPARKWAEWNVAGSWTKPLVGDFNGDHNDDLFAFNLNNADVIVARSTGSGFDTETWSEIYSYIKVYAPQVTFPIAESAISFDVGDFNGDWKDDILVRDAAYGNWAFLLSEGTKFSNITVPQTLLGWSNIYYLGDFDGDNKTELLGWNSQLSPAQWEYKNFSDTAIVSGSTFGSVHGATTGWKVIDVDWDGDEDLVRRAPAEDPHDWWVLLATPAGFVQADSPEWDDWMESAVWSSPSGELMDAANPLVLSLPGGGNVTSEPKISVHIPDEFSPSQLVYLLIGTDGDGRANRIFLPGYPANVARDFEIVLDGLVEGEQSVRVLLRIAVPQQQTGRRSTWSEPFVFTYQRSQLPLPEIIGLANDNGTLSNDKKTLDPTLRYTLDISDPLYADYVVEFAYDDLTPDDIVAVTSSGEQLFTPSLARAGTHSVRARTRARQVSTNQDVYSEWSESFQFSLSTNIEATIRDFKAKNNSDTDYGHPHFEGPAVYPYVGVHQQMVEPTLGADGKPVYRANSFWVSTVEIGGEDFVERDANGNPVGTVSPNPLNYDPDNSSRNLGDSGSSYQFTPEEYFELWYQDAEGWNQRFTTHLLFEETEVGSGVFEFNDTTFFPIDDEGFGNQGRDHNYHFTLDLHAQFTYHSGQSIDVLPSDDDLWIFVDNKLALDLGGIHASTGDSFDLDSLGLEDGKTYSFDVFFAERHTNQSNLQLRLRLADFQVLASDVLLEERDRFLTDNLFYGSVIPVTLPASGADAISFEVDNILFDTSDPDSINDAFELLLVDAAGNSVVSTVGIGQEAFINFTEGEEANIAQGIAFVPIAGGTGAQGRVYVDVSHLPGGSELFLVGRLINTDGLDEALSDDDTVARIRATTLEFHDTLPAGVTLEGAREFVGSLHPTFRSIDFGRIEDVTSRFTLDYGTTTFESFTEVLSAELAIAAASGTLIRGTDPFLLVVRNISDPSVTLEGAHGLTPDGDAYYDLSSLAFAGPGDNLSDGETLTGWQMKFSNPNHVRFGYDLRLLGRPNSAPILDPDQVVPAAVEFAWNANVRDFNLLVPARDEEGDAVDYVLLSHPDGMTIDASTGLITWPAASIASLGSHVITVSARDPFGGLSEPLSFTLNVISSPNRPPRITTEPVVDAYIGQAYAYDVDAVDADGDTPLTYTIENAGVLGPLGFSIDAATGMLTFTPTAAMLDDLITVELSVADSAGGVGYQTFGIKVHPDPLNSPPRIISTPESEQFVPASPSGTLGDVSPISLTLSLGQGETTTRNVSLDIATGIKNTADIVFIVDESISMDGEHTWLVGEINNDTYEVVTTSIVEQIEAELEARGITGNRYGIVGYNTHARVFADSDGGSLYENALGPWVYDDSAIDTIAEVRGGHDSNSIVDTNDFHFFQRHAVGGSLGSVTSEDEKAYEAIQTAIEGYTFRPEASVHFILVTDEDADGFDQEVMADLINDLRDHSITFSVIAKAEIAANDGAGNTEGFVVASGNWETTAEGWIGVPDTQTGTAAILSTFDHDWIFRTGSEGGNSWSFAEQRITFEFTMGSLAEDGGQVRFVFGYGSETVGTPEHYKFLEADLGQGKWRVGNVLGTAGESIDLIGLDAPVEGRNYRITVSMQHGGEGLQAFHRVWIDDNEIEETFLGETGGLTAPIDPLSDSGKVGLLAINAALRVTGFEIGTGDLGVGAVNVYGRKWRQEFGTEGSRPAMGLVSPSRGILDDGAGGVIENGVDARLLQQLVISPNPDEYFFVPEHFAPLVSQTNGSIWDLNLIENYFQLPTLAPQAFSTAFADQFSQFLYDRIRPVVVATEPGLVSEVDVVEDSSSTTASFDVSFVGDGRAHNFYLQFRDQYNEGSLLGQIPVRIYASYDYDLKAVDPDNDSPLVFDWADPTTDHYGATLTAGGHFRWNPHEANLPPDDYEFSVRVQDGRGGEDVQTWTVTLSADSENENTPPEFVSPIPVTPPDPTPLPAARQHQLYEYRFAADDQDGDAVRYYLGGDAPLDATIDPVTGFFSWRPRFQDDVAFDVIAEDGRGGQSVLTVSIAVESPLHGNSAPVLSGTPVRSAVVGEIYRTSLFATDSDNDAVRYSLSVAPRGMVIDEQTGEIYWTPGSNQLGSARVVVLAEDSRQSVDVQSFAIEVYPRNSDPQMEAIPRLRIGKGDSFGFQVRATDPNGDVLYYEIDPRFQPPGWLSIDANGLMAGTVPANDAEAEHYVEVVVTDHRGGVARRAFSIAVEESQSQPIFLSEPVTTAFRNVEYLYTPVIADADGGPLTLSLDDWGELLGMELVDGSVHWTPSGFGEHPAVTLTATDASGLVATQVLKFFVYKTPTATNNPIILSDDPHPAAADLPFLFPIQAVSPLGRGLTYAINDASMSIGSSSGVISWTPGTADIGNRHVVVTVTDVEDSSLVTVYEFDLPVVANSPPIITPPPIQQLNIDESATYSYGIVANDPNPGDQANLRYYLSGPHDPGIQINELTGEITFTPVQTGVYPIAVMVADGRGEVSIVRFPLHVVDNSNTAPVIDVGSRLRIQAGQTYRQQLTATDLEGDDVTFQKVDGPLGLCVDSSGFVEWQTSPSDGLDGLVSFQVKAIDRWGAESQTQIFVIEVIAGIVADEAPTIDSLPDRRVTVGDEWSYKPVASDPEHDVVFWSLLLAPAAMTIDPKTGAMSWLPTVDDIGVNKVVVRVEDGFGAYYDQAFEIAVRGVNLPPVQINDPPVQAFEDVLFEYPIAQYFVDPEGDPITANFAGFGNPIWFYAIAHDPQLVLGGFPELGTHSIVLEISDGTNSFIHQFELQVSAGDRSLPPQFGNERPASFGVVGQTYHFTTGAYDPNGDDVTFTVSDPAHMSVNSEGVFTWDTTGLTAGEVYPASITLSDGETETELSFYVQMLAANQAPAIVGAPDVWQHEAGTDLVWDFSTYVADPNVAADGDYLRYAIKPVDDSWPAVGPKINQGTGLITWPKNYAAEVGLQFDADIVVIDRVGSSVTKRVHFSVVTDQTNPTISVRNLNSGVVELGESIRLYVDSNDNVGIDHVTVKIQNLAPGGSTSNFDITSTGFVLYTPEQTGHYRIQATARDLSGRSTTTAPIEIEVIDSQLAAPTVEILTPSGLQVIREPVDVTGVIDFPPGAVNPTYSVTLTAAQGNGVPVLEGSGTAEVLGGALGSPPVRIDPRLLADGSYTLRVVAKYDGARSVEVTRTLQIQSDSKTGNFGLSFIDMQVPVAGIPIIISRSYDSYRVASDDDFGAGWRLDIANTDLEVDADTVRNGLNSSYDAFRDGTLVTVTLPNGTRETFEFKAESSGGIGGRYFRPAFKPLYGATSRLYVGNSVLLERGARDGEYITYSAGGAGSYNPADPIFGGGTSTYKLVTPNGMQFVIDAETGDLLGQIDRSGNEIIYTGISIVSKATGEGISWRYDSDGRISSLTGPRGQQVTYHYSSTGDLVGVVNQASEQIEYLYDPSIPHLLTTIKSQGQVILEAVYDEAGRLDKLVDPSGAPANVQYQLDREDGLIIERVLNKDHATSENELSSLNDLGDASQITEVVKNSQGRVIREVRHVREQQSPSDPESWFTSFYMVRVFEYDANGYRTAESELIKLPGTTEDPYTAAVTPVFMVISKFDAMGKLLQTENILGEVTLFEYDNFGNLSVVTDALGHRTISHFDKNTGKLVETIDAEGRVTRFVYGSFGLLYQVRQVEIVDGHEVVTFLSTTDSNSQGLPVRVTDANGETRHYRYDDRGQLILSYRRWENPSGTDQLILDRTLYDESGRVIAQAHYVVDESIPPYGNGTAAIELLDGVLNDDLSNGAGDSVWLTRTYYDHLGQTVRTVDRFGGETWTTYDKRGLEVQTASRTKDDSDPTSVQWLVQRTVYDEDGRETWSTDPFIVEAATLDAINASSSPEVRGMRTYYDSLGRISRTVRLEGIEVNLTLQVDLPGEEDLWISAVTSEGTPILHPITHAPLDFISVYDDEHGGRLLYSRDETGIYSRPVYDLLGRVVESQVFTSDLFLSVPSTPPDYSTKTIFDAVGRVVQSIDPLGRSTWYEYDRSGRQIATVTDAVYDPETNQEVYLRTETEYDAFGRASGTRTRLRQLNPLDKDSLVTSTDTLTHLASRLTTRTYTSAGQLESVTLPYVHSGEAGLPVYQYDYDEQGNLVSITDPKGRVTKFTFDSEGRQTSRTLPLGVDSEEVPDDYRETTTFQNERTNPEQTLFYGQIAEEVDFEGRITRYAYDNSPGGGGRVASIERFLPGSTSYDEKITYEYDAFGRLVTSKRYTPASGTSDPDRTEVHTYDEEGRLTSRWSQQREYSPVAVRTEQINYAFDSLGRHTQTSVGTNPNNPTEITEYGYDLHGRLTSVEVTKRFGSALNPGEMTEYGYDAAGNLDWEILPTGVTIDYVYDNLDRLIEMLHFVDADDNHMLDWDDADEDGVYDVGEGERPLAIFQETYDIESRRVQAIDRSFSGSSSVTRITDWAYDELGRLAREDYDGPNEYSRTWYEYDLVGNRTRIVRDGNRDGLMGSSLDIITTYHYDRNDRIVWEKRDVTFDGNGDRYIEYFYGDNGQSTQLVQRDEFEGLVANYSASKYLGSTEYAYDVSGRLIEVTTDERPNDSFWPYGDAQHSYAYSIAGDRVRVKVASGSPSDQRMLIDTQNPTGYSQVLLVSAGTAKTFYTLGLDVISQTEIALQTKRDLLYDPHGSTRALISTNPGTGAPDINNGYFWTYDAYGNAIESVNIEATALRFSGEWTDATGMQHLRARGYEPLTGTFLTSDPYSGDISNPQSLHKYLYAHADPVNGVDPSGMIFGAAGVGVSSSISTSLRVATTVTAGAALQGLGFGSVAGAFAYARSGDAGDAWVAAKSGATYGLLLGIPFVKYPVAAYLLWRFGNDILSGSIELDGLTALELTSYVIVSAIINKGVMPHFNRAIDATLSATTPRSGLIVIGSSSVGNVKSFLNQFQPSFPPTGFTGVWSTATRQFWLAASGDAELAGGGLPLGRLPRAGGHRVLADAVVDAGEAESVASLRGFAIQFAGQQQLRITWRSGSLNGSLPSYEIPVAERAAIIRTVQQATGLRVDG